MVTCAKIPHMDCLYVFVDESGNLDFSLGGTKYFVLCAITAIAPLESSHKLQQLKYDLLSNGNGGADFQCFHASEDRQIVRDEVFKVIDSMNSVKINYLIAEKRKTHPIYHNQKFYGLLGATLAKYLLLKNKKTVYQKIIIVFDQILTKKEQGNFLKTVKPLLKEIGKPYAIYFHRTMSDFNGQIADYCAWAKFISLEREEMRALKSISNIPQEVFDIFNKGDTYYY